MFKACQGDPLTNLFNAPNIYGLERVLTYEDTGMCECLANKFELGQKAAQDLFNELKVFLFFYSRGGVPLKPPKKIDLAWQEFILHPRAYAEFCAEHCICKFIHRPSDM